jgi:Mycothiol maleylpyruvate isomerase N-terminal domain
VIERSPEADAFLTMVTDCDPQSISSCTGWTAHEIAAHVTGIAVEVNRHLDPFLQGDPVPATRSFEEREAPLQAMPHGDLLVRLEAEEHGMRALVAEVLEKDAESVIPWTGRHMAVAKFIPHLRNEHALHRWDVVGDDDTSMELLNQSDLSQHSVEVLGQILLVAGRKHDPEPDADFFACLHADGEKDLCVVVQDGEASLNWDDTHATPPSVDCDPAARLLFIWGRHPEGRGRLRSRLPLSQLSRLQTLLAGY